MNTHCYRRQFLRVAAAAAASGLFLRGRVAAADEASKLALVFAKVLSYDQRLAESKGTSVGVAAVYAPKSADSKKAAEAWVKELATLKGTKVHGVSVEASAVPFDKTSLTTAVQEKGLDVLIGCDGVSVSALSAISRGQKVLSAGSTRASVEQGLGMCVLLTGDKPQIVINLAATKAEGARFSAKLLKLSEVL